MSFDSNHIQALLYIKKKQHISMKKVEEDYDIENNPLMVSNVT